MSPTNIKYPPPAHPFDGESAQKPTITSVQPRAGATMVAAPDNDTSRRGKAERLRGGCIPCPVCANSFVMYSTPHSTLSSGRKCVGSYQYLAAVAKDRAALEARKCTAMRAGGSTPQTFIIDVTDILRRYREPILCAFI
jgi:hypothetical protein